MMKENKKKMKQYKGFTVEKSWLTGCEDANVSYSAEKGNTRIESDSIKQLKKLIDEIESIA